MTSQPIQAFNVNINSQVPSYCEEKTDVFVGINFTTHLSWIFKNFSK